MTSSYDACIKPSNWKTTMEMISNYWVKSVIRPSGVDQCGNHIGARRFSSNSDSFQVRFIDFEPPIPEDYKDFPNFAHYIGYKFENEPYTSGSSEIGEALRRVRVYDLPSARPGIDIETSCWFQAIRLALEYITISI